MQKTVYLILTACLFFFIGCTKTGQGLKNTKAGILTVQTIPENAKVDFIRVYDKKLPFLKTDMAPQGRGIYRSFFPVGAEVVVTVNDGKKEISKTINVPRNEHKYLEFIVGKKAAKVDFIRMKANREFSFQPINKASRKKAIYLSYIDYIGQNLKLKPQIEAGLKKLGYHLLEKPDSKTELIATINLVDFSIKKDSLDFNSYEVIKYKFKINIEQRLTGKTVLEQKFANSTAIKDSINFGAESYPLDDTKREKQETIAAPQIMTAKETEKAKSAGLLVAMGVVKDDAAGAEEAEAKTKEQVTPPEDPAAAITGDEKKEEKKEEEKKEETTEAPALPPNTYLATGGIASTTTLNYHSHKEEATIETSVRLINLEHQEDEAIKQVISVISDRLVNLFNL